MLRNLDHHLARHVASGLARQNNLADLTGERHWSVDMTAGTITFGDDLSFPIQVLGSESERDGTWLWAWANTPSNIPPGLLRAAEWLREYGRQHDIAELTEAELPLDHVDGHTLAILSAGLTGRCHYRGPYRGGAAFFLLEEVPEQVSAPVRPEEVFPLLSQTFELFELDHRTVVESFLLQQGWRVEPRWPGLVGLHPGGSELTLELDERGRAGRVRVAIRYDD